MVNGSDNDDIPPLLELDAGRGLVLDNPLLRWVNALRNKSRIFRILYVDIISAGQQQRQTARPTIQTRRFMELPLQSSRGSAAVCLQGVVTFTDFCFEVLGLQLRLVAQEIVKAFANVAAAEILEARLDLQQMLRGVVDLLGLILGILQLLAVLHDAIDVEVIHLQIVLLHGFGIGTIKALVQRLQQRTGFLAALDEIAFVHQKQRLLLEDVDVRVTPVVLLILGLLRRRIHRASAPWPR